MSRCGYSLRCSRHIGDIANNGNVILCVLFTMFMAQFGHRLQCLCNTVRFVYILQVTFWAMPTTFKQYSAFDLDWACHILDIAYSV